MMSQQVLLCMMLINGIYCANILYVAPLASPSHYIWNKILSIELVKNGHNVTMITHDSDKSPNVVKNYTVITMEGFYDYINNNNIKDEYISDSNMFNTILLYSEFTEMTCQHDFQTEGFKTLMEYPANFKFDLIIFDITHPICLYGLVPKFHNPPVVGVTAFVLPPYLSYSLGNPLFTSYMPFYETKFTNQMNFKERLLNALCTWLDIMSYKYITNPQQTKLAKMAFGETTISSLEEIERNISILLVNIDPVFDYPIALAPNIIPVGGLHVKPGKRLPEDFELIYSKAEHGVILFSLGTNLNADIFKEEGTNVLLSVFAKLRQVVIWKYDAGELKNLPNNVIIKKWLPQNDLLGHPKTKLFITHCGALGTQEAMYHAVPMLGFPVFVDQNVNAAKLAHKKISIYLDYRNLTFDVVYNAITEIIENPMYKNNIIKISQRYKSTPQTALERGVFWIEQVLKFGSVDYLSLPARDMHMYETLNLDVIAFLIVTLIFVCAIMQVIIKLICTLCRSNGKKIKEKAT